MPWRVTGKAGEQCENFSIQWRSNERRRVAVSPTRNDCRRGMDRIKLRIS